jgi:serine/threonine-protein kinase ULK/ATG1
MDNLLPPDNVRKIIGCIADALRHLHARGIAHRDIKLANVLLKKDFTIKLADFGFAREAGGEEVMMQTYCGTPITMAPEILQGRPYDKKCDLWSLGVILFQLVFGKLPFPIDQGYVVFINKVTTERVKLPPQPKISNSLAELLYGCLERDQIKRLSIEEFLESGWMKEAPSNQTQQCEKNESVS